MERLQGFQQFAESPARQDYGDQQRRITQHQQNAQNQSSSRSQCADEDEQAQQKSKQGHDGSPKEPDWPIGSIGGSAQLADEASTSSLPASDLVAGCSTSPWTLAVGVSALE